MGLCFIYMTFFFVVLLCSGDCCWLTYLVVVYLLL